MPDDQTTDDRDELARSVKRFMAASRTTVDTLLRPHGIGAQQWWVLDQLAHRGDLRQRDLATAMHVERATASEIVLALVRKDLVVQLPDPADQRQKLLRLTPTGTALQRTVPDPMTQLYDIAFAGCTPRQLQAARRLLTAATHRLETHPSEGGTP